MGGAWLAAHIWKHYRYTMDQAFLDRMMPVLEDVYLFQRFMIEDHGEMICLSVLFLRRYLLSGRWNNGEVPAQAVPWIPES